VTSDIWLGDLMSAIGTLAPENARTRQRIAELLGFTARSGVPLEVPPPEPEEPLPSVDTTPTQAPSGGAANDLQQMIEGLPALRPRVEATSSSETVTPIALTGTAPSVPSVTPSLLSPLAARYILNELVMTPRFGPEPDVMKIVERVARLEIPQPLPLRARLTLARGVQVLTDRGEGMEPFAVDQRNLVGTLELIVGPSLIESVRFYEVPDEDDRRYPWSPPPPGQPVLALTDFGLFGRSTRTSSELVRGWHVVADTLASRGSELIALVPCPSTTWPPALRSVMRIVAWDRPTTAAAARRTRIMVRS